MEERERPGTERSNKSRNARRARARKRRKRNLALRVILFCIIIVGVIGGAFLIK